MRYSMKLLSLLLVIGLAHMQEELIEEAKELTFLGGIGDCKGGEFGISWYSTFNAGTSLDKATNTQDIELCTQDGFARWTGPYNVLTCTVYHSACGEEMWTNIKEKICKSFSKYEKNTWSSDRIIFAPDQKPDINQIKNFEHSMDIIVADLGSSSSLANFYNKLPSECKKSLNLTFGI